MDKILILQIIFILLMFLLNLLCALIPLKFVSKDPVKNKRTERVLGLCCCFSGGVFLGTCYLQLIPYLQRKFEKIFILSDWDMHYTEITTQCIIMAGFFLILVIEQAIQVWQEKKLSKAHSHKYRSVGSKTSTKETNLTELNGMKERGYIASDSSLSNLSDNNDNHRSSGIKKFSRSTTRNSSSRGGEKSNISSGARETPSISNNKNKASSSVLKNTTTYSMKSVRTQRHKSEVVFDSESSDMEDKEPLLNSKTNSRSNIQTTEFSNLEHGHSHGHEGHSHLHIADIMVGNTTVLRSLLLFGALSVHSLFEGMAVGLQETVMALINLFIGVLLHECLIAFSVGMTMAQHQNHIRKSAIVLLCTVFSLMIPIGMLVGLLIGGLHGFYAEMTSAVIQGIAAGTFVYVIFFEILPAEINNQQDKLLKVPVIFLGFVVILCLQLALNEHNG